jgi:hypothetical protein
MKVDELKESFDIWQQDALDMYGKLYAIAEKHLSQDQKSMFPHQLQPLLIKTATSLQPEPVISIMSPSQATSPQKSKVQKRLSGRMLFS